MCFFPVLGFLLAAVAVFLIGRASNPRPPKDGTPGPWCPNCRYSLTGLAESIPCPECGNTSRDRWPVSAAYDGPPPGGWGLTAALVSIAIHLPVYVFWLFHRPGIELSVIAIPVILLYSVMAAVVITALAARSARQWTLVGFVTFSVTQLIADLIAMILVIVHPPREYDAIIYAIVPLWGMCLAPYVFALAILCAATHVWLSRRTKR